MRHSHDQSCPEEAADAMDARKSGTSCGSVMLRSKPALFIKAALSSSQSATQPLLMWAMRSCPAGSTRVCTKAPGMHAAICCSGVSLAGSEFAGSNAKSYLRGGCKTGVRVLGLGT
jgi:hypothetical protein